MTAARGVRVELPCSSEHTGVVAVRARSASELPESARCATCGHDVDVRRSGLTETGGLAACLGCGHPELYTRKDFPPAIGIGIVVVAAALVPFLPKWYPSLIAAAILDLLLYRFAPDAVVCYVCGTVHRGFAPRPKHPRFDRTIEERLRYGERAVMGSPMRPGGTADGPEPEH